MKPIRTLKISISGVRGVIGDSLSPPLLTRFAESFGTYLNSGKIVVGRDTRTSGEMVKHAVFAGLMSTGCQGVDLDICPVPTVQLMVRKLGARGGIAITASHNPVEWNALKLIRSDGCFLNSYQAEELLSIYHQGDFRKARNDKIKQIKRNTLGIPSHLEQILKHYGPVKWKGRRLKVAIDCCNGAGSLMTPRLLHSLECDLVSINTIPDGIFPHPPEPVPQNLTDLCRLVKESEADVGFAQDADADRLAIVSEKGVPIGEDNTLALAVKFLLSQERGTVVTNLSTTQAIDDIAQVFNCRVIRTKIGEVNVTETMKKEEAIIGGEGNGGVIFPRINFARDSMVGITLVLHYMALAGSPLSTLVEDLPRYYFVKQTVPCPSSRVRSFLNLLKETYSREKMDLTDGLKILRPDSWAHIRPSNTEPIMRIVVEARSEEAAQVWAREIIAKMGNG
ncbi:MAG: phosphoglucosamine mutase [Acidobacteria bacterium]|nr:MAG: phosphoglucosamine mutase [Acidobacteriota bacterium]